MGPPRQAPEGVTHRTPSRAAVLATSAVVLAAAALALGCDKDKGPDLEPVFAHGSPRPECRYEGGVGRTPYAMPQVVAGGWGAPVKLSDPLGTDCPEDAIEISRDGSVLYFYWSPEVNAAGDELLSGTTGTYAARKSTSDPGSFSDPRFFELRKGATSGACDGELSFTPAGDSVYFHSLRAENTGYRQSPPVDDFLDIYVAKVVAGEPGPAVNLGQPVNSIYPDGEHCLSPDGTRLYLSSTRPGGFGQTDIWMSQRQGGAWSQPINLGQPINSAASELQPAFAADDPSTLYFVSDRDGPSAIYRSVHAGERWSQPERLITGYVGEPSLVADGSLLYFVHVLVDSAGVFGSDIWYVRRQR